MLGQTSTRMPTAMPSSPETINQPRSPAAPDVNAEKNETAPVASA